MIKQSTVFLIALLAYSCSPKVPKIKVIQGNAFGTTYTIQYYSMNEWSAEKGIDSVLNAVNKSVNTYVPNSDISKINQGDSMIVVDDVFREVFEISLDVFNKSNGYFDPTIGVLRNAYGFGDTKAIQYIDSIKLDSLRRFVGFDKVSITSAGTIKKEFPEIYFDFNAVAKGYGIDQLGIYLEQHGVSDYLIELGGELRSKGTNIHKNKSWIVGLESLDSELDQRSFDHIVEISNEGMATSGNYRKFRIDSLTGKKYVHTINPLTGKAEESDVTSATVFAPSCALADAYATTFMAMGYERSLQMLASLNGIDVYLTYIDKDHQPQWFATEGFQKKMLE